jgi:CRP/FNR family cyclic AMP-dependent transcriptional regulator
MLSRPRKRVARPSSPKTSRAEVGAPFVRRLLDHPHSTGGNSRPVGLDNEASDFFPAVFTERAAAERPELATWAARAAHVRAEPVERRRGCELFVGLWGNGRPMAALVDEDVPRLADYLQFVSVPAGQEVIGQDEQGDYLLIVLDGTLAVDRVQPWGSRVRLAEARAGEMLGEMSLLDAGARCCACTTISPCLFAVVDSARLTQMIEKEPRLALALLASLARRLSLRLRQVSARLSALLSSS